ncbi:MAG: hypothetical protein ACRERC_17270 [Candidatus Binatia bacterium]
MLTLRRSHPPGARLLGVVALVLTAAVGHGAVATVTISDDECREVTQEIYAAHGDTELQSQCPNLIRIIALALDCNPSACEPPTESATGIGCEVGLTVPPGGSCELPSCPC